MSTNKLKKKIIVLHANLYIYGSGIRDAPALRMCFLNTIIQDLSPSPALPAQSPEPRSLSASPQPPEPQQQSQVQSTRPKYLSEYLFVIFDCFMSSSKVEDEEVFEEIRRLRLERGRLLQKIKTLEQQQQSALSALKEVLQDRECNVNNV